MLDQNGTYPFITAWLAVGYPGYPGHVSELVASPATKYTYVVFHGVPTGRMPTVWGLISGTSPEDGLRCGRDAPDDPMCYERSRGKQVF